ncbi:MAG: 5-formyltetrahydrofolate cyclo-ligase [Candidatus Zapsychrus exili]|nr:5-formyltetrahydrofolate cyclo-ligase [Candidatus Zapsychrus exili]
MEKQTKEVLRNKILTLLRNQKEEDRSVKSLCILNKLFKIPEFKNANTVLFYASFDGEVDTFEMIKQAKQLGKKIGLPRINKNDKEITPILVEYLEKDLEAGPYGIKQPIDNGTNRLDLNDIDLVCVPGVAFDKKNNRLGRGGGYYDRFLSRLSSRIPTIGLAFDLQIVDEIPLQKSHDIPVSQVILN